MNSPGNFPDGRALEALATTIIETVLPEHAATQYRAGAVSHEVLRRFIAPIQALSERYVTNQAVISSERLLSEAYALYFLPINAAKFAEVARQVALPMLESATVLDFGSGPATASLALLPWLGMKSHITLYDPSTEMTSLGARLLAAQTHTPVTTTTTLPQQTYSLILAGNVFAEIPDAGIDAVVEAMVERLAPGGTIICIEPALKVATQRLMRVRDLFCRYAGLDILFPCSHLAPCPMLSRTPHDWCHGELTWVAPRLVQTLDELTGFNKHRIKYSACVMRAGPRQERDHHRVVTPPENDRRGTYLTLCGPEYFDLVRLSKRNRSEANLAFRRASLWDALTINPTPIEKEISPETAVTTRTPERKGTTLEEPR